MSNNARAGGILSIISGVFGVMWAFGSALLGFAVRFANYNNGYYYRSPGYVQPTEGVLTAAMAFFLFFAAVFAAIGALAIVGGVFALNRKYWGWSLAGAIAGLFTFFPTGVPAIVFVSIGKAEFIAPWQQHLTPPTPPAPPQPPTQPPSPPPAV